MKYKLEIKSVIDNTTITVGATAQDLALLSLTINYNYLSYSSPGTATVVGFQSSTLVETSIKGGSVLFVYEGSVRIYVGYITRLMPTKTTQGRQLIIKFDTILSQFTKQKMLNTSDDNIVTIPSDKVSILNIGGSLTPITFQDLLSQMMKTTLYQYLINKYSFGSSSAGFTQLYQATQLLKPTQKVIYVPVPGSTIESALRQILYAYQIITYQNPNGDLIFTIPAYNNKSSLNVDYGNNNVTSVVQNNNELNVDNNVVVNLAKLGFILKTAIAENNNVTARSTPNPKYFPHLVKLMDTGYFYKTNFVSHPLPKNNQLDSTMLNALNFVLANPTWSCNTNVPKNTQLSPATMAPLLANRILAESLVAARTITVNMVRNEDYTELPLGMIFTAEKEQWIATNIRLSLSVSSNKVYNTLTIIGSLPSTCTGAWQQSNTT